MLTKSMCWTGFYKKSPLGQGNDKENRTHRRHGIGFRCAIMFAAAIFCSQSALMAPPARAQTGSIPFAGVVDARDFCAIVLIEPGTLAPSVDGLLLSSKETGGVAATADVHSGKNKKVSVDAPSSFITMPPDGNTNVTFETFHSGTSILAGKNYAEVPGTKQIPVTGNNSITRVSINLVATRTVTTFPGGDYTAEAILRCE